MPICRPASGASGLSESTVAAGSTMMWAEASLDSLRGNGWKICKVRGNYEATFPTRWLFCAKFWAYLMGLGS